MSIVVTFNNCITRVPESVERHIFYKVIEVLEGLEDEEFLTVRQLSARAGCCDIITKKILCHPQGQEFVDAGKVARSNGGPPPQWSRNPNALPSFRTPEEEEFIVYPEAPTHLDYDLIQDWHLAMKKFINIVRPMKIKPSQIQANVDDEARILSRRMDGEQLRRNEKDQLVVRLENLERQLLQLTAPREEAV